MHRHKLGSYVDLVFTDVDHRSSFAFHEQFAKRLTELLRRAPQASSSVEVCLRRCYFGDVDEIREGFYFTVYINGYGSDNESARWNWGVALNLTGNAIGQLSSLPL